MNIDIFQTSDQGWPACGRLGRQTSARTKTTARLKITFVDMTYPKGWTGSLSFCPLIFSCYAQYDMFQREKTKSFDKARINSSKFFQKLHVCEKRKKRRLKDSGSRL